METSSEQQTTKRLRPQTAILLFMVLLTVIAAGWVMVTVSTTSQIPPSAFVTLPTTPLAKNGTVVVFSSISAIAQKGVAVGVQGYLRTAAGEPVAGAKVYMTYYLQGAYRTQVATTDQNGHFEARFPMNWTGWLPVTLAYFGDVQHQGLRKVFSVSGENL